MVVAWNGSDAISEQQSHTGTWAPLLHSVCAHLTTLDCYLLLTLVRCERKKVVPCNFALVWDEWSSYRKKLGGSSGAGGGGGGGGAGSGGAEGVGASAALLHSFPRPMAWKAFESLLSRDWIRVVDARTVSAVNGAVAGAATHKELNVEADDGSGSAAAAASLAPLLAFPSFTGANSSSGGGGSYAQKEFRTVRLSVPPGLLKDAILVTLVACMTAVCFLVLLVQS
jgi:uncharacterized membrane protein YgcG